MTNNRAFSKIVSSIIIVAFLANNLFIDRLYAQSLNSPVNSSKTLAVNSISIPKEFGTITQVYQGSSDKVIIHIQDLHTHYQAQNNEAKIIEHLMNQYGAGLICVEGAAGDFSRDLKFFRKYPKEDDLREKAARFFMRKGYLTGADYVGITSKFAPEIFGVEDAALYQKNLSVFNSYFPDKEKIIAQLKNLEPIIAQLKDKLFPKSIKDFELQVKDYEENKIELSKFLPYLIKIAKQTKQPEEAYKDLQLLFQSLEMKKQINTELANDEQKVLFEQLKALLFPEEVGKLNTLATLLSQGLKQQAQYYEYLQTLIDKHLVNSVKPSVKLSLAAFKNKYSNFLNYAEYIICSARVDSSKIDEELSDLTFSIKISLCDNEAQKGLVKSSKTLALILEFLGVQLLPQDYSYFQVNQEFFQINYLLNIIRQFASRYNIVFDERLLSNLESIDGYLPKIVDFYNIAEDREKALLENMFKRMDSPSGSIFSAKPAKRQSAILITGGFHTRGITKNLREKGISYVVISPKITEPMDMQKYFNILNGRDLEPGEIAAAGKEIQQLENSSLMVKNFVVGCGTVDWDKAKQWWRAVVAVIRSPAQAEPVPSESVERKLGEEKPRSVQRTEITVEEFLKEGASLEDYSLLDEAKKRELRKRFAETFPAIGPDRQHALVDDSKVESLVESAQQMMKQFPEGDIVAVGRSPLWFVETAQLLSQNKGRFKRAAFSGRWFDHQISDRKHQLAVVYADKPSPEQLKIYRKYLESLGITPKAIMSKPHKTILVDLALTGTGFRSFINVLEEWAKEERIPVRKFRAKIQVHLFLESETFSPSKVKEYLDLFKPFNTSYQVVDSTLIADWFKDSPGVKFSSYDWGRIDPSAVPMSENAALVRFRIIDYLMNKKRAQISGDRIVLDEQDSGLHHFQATVRKGLTYPDEESIRLAEILKKEPIEFQIVNNQIVIRAGPELNALYQAFNLTTEAEKSAFLERLNRYVQQRLKNHQTELYPKARYIKIYFGDNPENRVFSTPFGDHRKDNEYYVNLLALFNIRDSQQRQISFIAGFSHESVHEFIENHPHPANKVELDNFEKQLTREDAQTISALCKEFGVSLPVFSANFTATLESDSAVIAELNHLGTFSSLQDFLELFINDRSYNEYLEHVHLLEKANLKPGDKLLEVGAGTSFRLALVASYLGMQVVSVNPDEFDQNHYSEFFDAIASNLESAIPGLKINRPVIIKKRIEETGFAESSFNAVTLFNILCDPNIKNRTEILELALKSLVDGGVLYLSIYRQDAFKVFWRGEIEKLVQVADEMGFRLEMEGENSFDYLGLPTYCFRVYRNRDSSSAKIIVGSLEISPSFDAGKTESGDLVEPAEQVRAKFEAQAKSLGGKGAWTQILGDLSKEIGFSVPPPRYLSIQELWQKFLEENKKLVDEGNKLVRDNWDGKLNLDQLEKLRRIILSFKMSKELEQLIIDRTKDLGEWVIARSSGSMEDSFVRNLAGVFSSIRKENPRELPSAIKKIFKHTIGVFWLDQNEQRKDSLEGVPRLLSAEEGFAILVQPFLSFDASGSAMSDFYGHTAVEAVIGDAETAVKPNNANVVSFLFRKGQGEEFEYNPTFVKTPYEFKLRHQEYSVKDDHDALERVMRGYPKIDGKFSPISAEQAKELNRVVNELEKRIGVPIDVEWGFLDGKLYILQVRPIIGDFAKPLVKMSPDLEKKQAVAVTPIALGHTAADGFIAPMVLFGSKVDDDIVQQFEQEFGQEYIRVQQDVASQVLSTTTRAKVLVDTVQGSRQAHNINLITNRIENGEFVYANGPVLREGLSRELNFVPHPNLPGVWVSRERVTYFCDGLRGNFYKNDSGSVAPTEISQQQEALTKFHNRVKDDWFEHFSDKEKTVPKILVETLVNGGFNSEQSNLIFELLTSSEEFLIQKIADLIDSGEISEENVRALEPKMGQLKLALTNPLYPHSWESHLRSELSMLTVINGALAVIAETRRLKGPKEAVPVKFRAFFLDNFYPREGLRANILSQPDLNECEVLDIPKMTNLGYLNETLKALDYDISFCYINMHGQSLIRVLEVLEKIRKKNPQAEIHVSTALDSEQNFADFQRQYGKIVIHTTCRDGFLQERLKESFSSWQKEHLALKPAEPEPLKSEPQKPEPKYPEKLRILYVNDNERVNRAFQWSLEEDLSLRNVDEGHLEGEEYEVYILDPKDSRAMEIAGSGKIDYLVVDFGIFNRKELMERALENGVTRFGVDSIKDGVDAVREEYPQLEISSIPMDVENKVGNFRSVREQQKADYEREHAEWQAEQEKVRVAGQEAVQLAKPASPKPEPKYPKKLHVLYVNDSSTKLVMLEDSLQNLLSLHKVEEGHYEGEEFEVHIIDAGEVGGVAEAERILNSGSIQYLITDWKMPGIESIMNAASRVNIEYVSVHSIEDYVAEARSAYPDLGITRFIERDDYKYIAKNMADRLRQVREQQKTDYEKELAQLANPEQEHTLKKGDEVAANKYRILLFGRDALAKSVEANLEGCEVLNIPKNASLEDLDEALKASDYDVSFFYLHIVDQSIPKIIEILEKIRRKNLQAKIILSSYSYIDANFDTFQDQYGAIEIGRECWDGFLKDSINSNFNAWQEAQPKLKPQGPKRLRIIYVSGAAGVKEKVESVALEKLELHKIEDGRYAGKDFDLWVVSDANKAHEVFHYNQYDCLILGADLEYKDVDALIRLRAGRGGVRFVYLDKENSGNMDQARLDYPLVNLAEFPTSQDYSALASNLQQIRERQFNEDLISWWKGKPKPRQSQYQVRNEFERDLEAWKTANPKLKYPDKLRVVYINDEVGDYDLEDHLTTILPLRKIEDGHYTGDEYEIYLLNPFDPRISEMLGSESVDYVVVDWMMPNREEIMQMVLKGNFRYFSVDSIDAYIKEAKEKYPSLKFINIPTFCYDKVEHFREVREQQKREYEENARWHAEQDAAEAQEAFATPRVSRPVIPAPQRPDKLRILIADDNFANARLALATKLFKREFVELLGLKKVSPDHYIGDEYEIYFVKLVDDSVVELLNSGTINYLVADWIMPDRDKILQAASKVGIKHVDINSLPNYVDEAKKSYPNFAVRRFPLDCSEGVDYFRQAREEQLEEYEKEFSAWQVEQAKSEEQNAVELAKLEPSKPKPKKPGELSVLYINDNPDILKTMGHFLILMLGLREDNPGHFVGEGYEVFVINPEFDDEGSAVSTIESGVDYLVTDWAIPNIDEIMATAVREKTKYVSVESLFYKDAIAKYPDLRISDFPQSMRDKIENFRDIREQQLADYERELAEWKAEQEKDRPLVAPVKPAPKNKPQYPQKLRILYLQDDPYIKIRLEKAVQTKLGLKKEKDGFYSGDNFEVFCVDSYFAAHDVLESKRIDYMITDWDIFGIGNLLDEIVEKRIRYVSVQTVIPESAIRANIKDKATYPDKFKYRKFPKDVASQIDEIRRVREKQLRRYERRLQAWQAAHPEEVVLAAPVKPTTQVPIFVIFRQVEQEGDDLIFLIKEDEQLKDRFTMKRIATLEDVRRRLAEQVPELVIIDSYLSKKDTLEDYMREIRAKNPNVKFIITGEDAAVFDRSRVEDAQVLAVIEKPFHFQEVMEVLREASGLRKEGSQVNNIGGLTDSEVDRKIQELIYNNPKVENLEDKVTEIVYRNGEFVEHEVAPRRPEDKDSSDLQKRHRYGEGKYLRTLSPAQADNIKRACDQAKIDYTRPDFRMGVVPSKEGSVIRAANLKDSCMIHSGGRIWLPRDLGEQLFTEPGDDAGNLLAEVLGHEQEHRDNPGEDIHAKNAQDYQQLAARLERYRMSRLNLLEELRIMPDDSSLFLQSHSATDGNL